MLQNLRLASIPALLAGCAGLAAASLLLPFAPLFDPWAWLVWGRELGHLDLDTTGGPSWKPLPVGFTTAVAPLGDAAPELWLVLARAGWLLAAVGAWRLAARLADPPGAAGHAAWRAGAGAIAAAALILLDDPFTAWLRQFAGGLSEPPLVAAVLWAVDRHLSGRSGQALALWFCAALIRPEAWPCLAGQAVYAARGDLGSGDSGGRSAAFRAALRPRPLAAALALALAVAALWLVPDLVGAGDPLAGAERAREGSGPPLGEALEAIGRAATMVPVAILLAAAVAVVSALRAGEREIPLLAAGAVAWVAVVAVLAALGFAGLPRFSAPAAAIVAVLGGVGTIRVVRSALSALTRHGRRFTLRRSQLLAGALATALVALLIAESVPRAQSLAGDADRASTFAASAEDLFDALDAAGSPEALGCRRVAVSDFTFQTAAAWRLDEPLGRVGVLPSTPPSGSLALVGPGAPAEVRAAARAAGRHVASRGHWSAYAIGCGP